MNELTAETLKPNPPQSLLARMTGDISGEIKLNDSQVQMVIEFMLPRIVTSMPGMPKGFTCTVDKDEDGWVLNIRRPGKALP